MDIKGPFSGQNMSWRVHNQVWADMASLLLFLYMSVLSGLKNAFLLSKPFFSCCSVCHKSRRNKAAAATNAEGKVRINDSVLTFLSKSTLTVHRMSVHENVLWVWRKQNAGLLLCHVSHISSISSIWSLWNGFLFQCAVKAIFPAVAGLFHTFSLISQDIPQRAVRVFWGKWGKHTIKRHSVVFGPACVFK